MSFHKVAPVKNNRKAAPAPKRKQPARKNPQGQAPQGRRPVSHKG